MWLKHLREFVWPILERPGADEVLQQLDSEAAELANIEAAEFKADPNAALTVATKIYESEEERGRSAETKSFYLLLVAAALIPLLTYLESAIGDRKFGTAPKWLSLPILVIAVVYLISAAYWAIKAVSVRIFHTLGPSDLVTVWRAGKPIELLVKEILSSTVRNQAGTNGKVSAVKMGMAFLTRAIFTFGILIVVQAAWEIAVVIAPVFASYLSKLACVCELWH